MENRPFAFLPSHSSDSNVSNQIEAFAQNIWEFIRYLHSEYSPIHIDIYHFSDGMVLIKCNDLSFFTIRHFCTSKELLNRVNSIAQKSHIKGKMFLHSDEDILNELNFKFSYDA